MTMSQENRLLLATQAALLGEITPNLRAVACQLDEDIVRLTFVYDESFSQEDRDRMESVAGEVISHFLEATLATAYVANSEPLSIDKPEHGRFAYLRCE